MGTAVGQDRFIDIVKYLRYGDDLYQSTRAPEDISPLGVQIGLNLLYQSLEYCNLFLQYLLDPEGNINVSNPNGFKSGIEIKQTTRKGTDFFARSLFPSS